MIATSISSWNVHLVNRQRGTLLLLLLALCVCVCVYMVILVVLVLSAPDIPASGIYFGVYEYLLRTLTPEGKRYTYTCSQCREGLHKKIHL